MNDMLQIKISSDAYLKLKYYVTNSDDEVSGLGKCENINGNITITDILLFEQKVSSASTVLDEEAMAKFMNDRMVAGDDISKYTVWWHSHANMGVFWSITDEVTITSLDQHSFIISLVTNKELEMLVRLDMNRPLEVSVNCGISISQVDDEELELQCIDELEEKVSSAYSFFKRKKKRAKRMRLIPTDQIDKEINNAINKSYGRRKRK